jgi:hypothetical protein
MNGVSNLVNETYALCVDLANKLKSQNSREKETMCASISPDQMCFCLNR